MVIFPVHHLCTLLLPNNMAATAQKDTPPSIANTADHDDMIRLQVEMTVIVIL